MCSLSSPPLPPLPLLSQDRVDFICGKEGVALDAAAFELLAQISGGDLRKAVSGQRRGQT